MTNRNGILQGGDTNEQSVVPGNSSESQLLRFASDTVEDLEMPPLDNREKYPSLSHQELKTLKDWIDAGAAWPTGVSRTPDD